MITHELRGQGDRVARRHRAVGPDINGQLVVVGRLAQTGRFDEVVDLADRRVHRVDRNPSDAQILIEVLVGRHIAAPLLDSHLHVQRTAVGDGGNVQARLEDFDVPVRLEVPRRDFAGLVRPQIQSFRLIRVELDRDLLEIQDDIGRVLHYTGNG